MVSFVRYLRSRRVVIATMNFGLYYFLKTI